MNVYEIVTDRILSELEKGRIPWRRPWRTEGPAINYLTRKEYRGINRLLLGGGEYLTYKQVADLGGTIKKGEKAHIVVFWKMYRKDEDEDVIPVLRYYNVFSIHQCEGIESKLDGVVKTDIAPISAAENVFSEYVGRENIGVKHSDPNRAFYQPSDDYINLPDMGQYDCAEEYYSTAFHEAAHSTGHESRLNRIKKAAAFGSASYSKEELVAEISAAYLCEFCGLDAAKTITNSAAYIQGWSSKLKQDPRLAVLAAGAAEKATEFILGGDGEGPEGLAN
jgi:antirestriction protein ArdC